jgi:hypothetical protein
MSRHDHLWTVVRKLPSDFEPYGERSREADWGPDCSCGCRWFLPLETDHVVISQKRSAPGYEHLIRRVREHGPSDCFVSIITFHEQVMG